MSFVYYKSGESLTQEELDKIRNNYVIGEHAKQRLKQRKLDPNEIPAILNNPYLAFYNIDQSVIVAKDDKCYLIFRYKKRQEKYVLITYVVQTTNKRTSVAKKQVLAKLKMKTPGLNRV